MLINKEVRNKATTNYWNLNNKTPKAAAALFSLTASLLLLLIQRY